ncbi:uncharacterized protein LOC144954059, partial [Lampetra fluviatilis]
RERAGREEALAELRAAHRETERLRRQYEERIRGLEDNLEEERERARLAVRDLEGDKRVLEMQAEMKRRVEDMHSPRQSPCQARCTSRTPLLLSALEDERQQLSQQIQRRKQITQRTLTPDNVREPWVWALCRRLLGPPAVPGGAETPG